MCGIEPVWASEIEPYPIRVTTARFPNMKHLGDVTKINGAEIEPVEIITFGSPCQDLSRAGKMAGIHDGERSSLFFHAIRIIREMREHDKAIGRANINIRPRFGIWENVLGALSSNNGEDFQAVLQAFCDISENGRVSIPKPSRWKPDGCVMGNGWSVAWSVLNVCEMGRYSIPQRRKRVYLIADFATERAGEILFEPESLCGDSSESERARENASKYVAGSIGRGDWLRWLKG